MYTIYCTYEMSKLFVSISCKSSLSTNEIGYSIYLTMNQLHRHTELNDGMIIAHEWLLKDIEGSSHGLIYGTIPACVWKCWWKPWRTWVGIDSNVGTSQIEGESCKHYYDSAQIKWALMNCFTKFSKTEDD